MRTRRKEEEKRWGRGRKVTERKGHAILGNNRRK
jgi:hypothetical protein